MHLLAKLTRDAFELWIGLLNLLGFKSPTWEWRKTRWKMSLEAKLASWEMTERGIRAPVRMCPHCRELVNRSLSTCPACGGSMAGVAGGGSKRLFATILPHFSSLTSVLITANVLLLAIPLITWGTDPEHGGLFSLLAPPWQAQFVFGSKVTQAILQWGQIWRLVTAGFLHMGILHLGMNCYALSLLGPLIENAFGWRKTLFIYVACDIAAFAVSTWWSPQAFSVGASGPLFGLLGFGFVFGRFRAGERGRLVAQQLMGFITPAIVMLFVPGIDNAAHIGGFLAGGILALMMDPGEPRTPAARRTWAILTMLTL
ncbi:MAG TPA: rhomboid family intramembrane serine protease, partial [Candidatus Polarisedimenticolia bacterium]|nr:rhomboid family intramembrane serine protease [Candidatus Polarisedimenticolia bacterium]